MRIIKIKIIRIDKEFQEAVDKPILYILPCQSESDLALLNKACVAVNLARPCIQNDIDNIKLSNYLFLKNKSDEYIIDNLSILNGYIELIQQNKIADVQVVVVSPFWGRHPGYENKPAFPRYNITSYRKIGQAIRYRKNNIFIKFSEPKSLMQYMQKIDIINEQAYKKLTRLINIYFIRQALYTIGPKIPDYNKLLQHILKTESVVTMINAEAEAKNLPIEEVEKRADDLLSEMATKWSVTACLIANRFLTWLWNKVYQGINVYNVDKIRDLPQVVYVPSHRSHMDYILLSYLLYNEGSALPHIAAGINLNFWPAGAIFRKGGAFFIRRTFSGDKLYSAIFKEYIIALFTKNASVEFFIEGGRTRSGLLLTPKTGMLSILIQSSLKSNLKPIHIVPIYIGYEKVIEADTYFKELQGAEKEKENAGLVLRMLGKLKNLGRASVSFGDPIPIRKYLSDNYPELADNNDSSQKNKILSQATDEISELIMININKAATVNAMNLVITTLFGCTRYRVIIDELKQQLKLYQEILSKTEYSKNLVVIADSPTTIIKDVLSLKGTSIIAKKDSQGKELIILPQNVAMISSYYSNNIMHLFIIPSLVAKLALIKEQESIVSKNAILDIITTYSMFFTKPYFLAFSDVELKDYYYKLIDVMDTNTIFSKLDNDNIKIEHHLMLKRLASIIDNVLIIYYIVLTACKAKNTENHEISNIEAFSTDVINKLMESFDVIIPAFYSCGTAIKSFVQNLRTKEYIDADHKIIDTKFNEFFDLVEQCIIENKLNLKEQIDSFIKN